MHRRLMGSEPPVGFVTWIRPDVDVPPLFVPCDGRRYRKAHYPELARLLEIERLKQGRPLGLSWWPWFRVPDERRGVDPIPGVRTVPVIKACMEEAVRR